VAPVATKGFELRIGRKPDPKALGAELRRLREQAQVTVSDLAERMGWIPQNVSRLEHGGGAREPMISSVNLYLRTLGYEMVITAKPKPPLKVKPPGDEDAPIQEDTPRSGR
jgi:transcriptional regulator with XRE-family HTH domain